MLRTLFQGLLYTVLAFAISSCAVRTYSQVKDRVDQEDVGNAGYVGGTKQPIDRSNFKKTRKFYVLEIEKKDKNTDKVMEVKPAAVPSAVRAEDRSGSMDYGTPSVSMPEEAVTQGTGAGGSEEYTVQEGDTLQKISKKFYDTYRKWEKIYEANKDTLKNNPNRIKPGMTLIIPKE